ncbi:MAG: hypothetical protein MUE96_11140, partial [Bacteroidia bacterium]|nr:hypothetical protein [Bacteroidia bacterium]
MKTISIQRAFLSLIFTFLGLFSQLRQANAQLLLDPASSGGPLSNVVASSGSANTSIAIAYSIRQLKTTYDHPATITPPAAVTGFTNSTQPLLRVRRSFDNAQLDIGYDINGNLDSVTLKNFVTGKIGIAGPTNPTASGFVTVWYDQSGNSRDAFQTNTSQQPRIINAGVIERNSGGQIGFYGVSGGMLEHQTSAGAPMNEPAGINIYGIDADRTMTVVSQPRVYANGGAADGGGTYLIDRNGSTGDQDRPLTCLKAVNNNWTAQIRNLAGDISSSFEGSVPISTSRSDNVFLLRSGDLYSLYVNGIFAGSNTLTGENRMTPVRIGYGTNTGEQVYYGEFILFPSALSNTNLTALNNSQNTYFVLGPSPGTWTGLLSSDWNTAGNWSNNAVPSSITDVTIPAGATTPLVITSGQTTLATKKLTIASGASVTINGNINVNDSFVMNGTTTGTGTITMSGALRQTIRGTAGASINNLVIANTTDTVWASTNINIAGTLTINANAEFGAVATAIVNSAAAAGTITGNGTVLVTRTASVADYQSQYRFTTNTLTNLTVNYQGAGDQSINLGLNHGNLAVSGSGIKTLSGAISATNVTGSITVNAGTLSTANNNIGSPTNRTITIGPNGILDAGSGIISFGTGTKTITINGTFRTANTNGFTGSATTAIANTNTPTVTLGAASTIEYSAATAQTVTARTDYANLTMSNGSKTVSGTITLSGALTINTGATYNGAANPVLTVAGNFTNNGTFTSGTGAVTFNGTTAQTITGATTFGGNVVWSGAGLKTLASNIVVTGDQNINSGATLNLATFTANRSAAGGTLTVAGTLRVGGNTGGQTGSNFPLNFTTNTLSGTVIYDGSNAITQTVFATTYTNITLTNGSGSGTANKISTASFTVNTGNFTINTGARFTPAAANIISGTGTLTGTGIVEVTGTDLPTQYTITNKVLTNLTINYAGGTQTIPSGTYSSLTVTGGGTKTLGGAVTVTGSVTIDASNTLDVSASNFALNVGGNFTNNGTFTQRAGTVTLNGSGSQTISGSTTTTFNNLTISKTTDTTFVNSSINVSGTLSIGTSVNTVFFPSATSIINATAAGTLSGTGGTIYVTRVLATADFRTQYNFSTYTLTNLTVNYSGAGNQTINITGTPTINYSNLVVSGSGTKTVNGAITGTNVTGNITVSAATMSMNNQNLGSPANRTITIAVGAIFDGGSGIISFGATTRVININGTFRTANTTAFSGNVNASISNTNTPTITLGTASTIEYYAAATQPVTARTDYVNVTFTGGSKTLPAGTRTIAGNLLINAGATYNGTTNNPVITVNGDFTNNGTFNQGTGTFTLGSTTTQSVGGTTTTSFGNITFSGSGGVATLTANIQITGNLTVSTGKTLNLSTFTANRTAAGGTLSVAGTLRVGGTTGGQAGSNFPSNFTTFTPTGGTVEYYANGGTTQTVFATTYNNLTLTNANGLDTAFKISTGNIGIGAGTFSIGLRVRFQPAAGNVITGAGGTLTGFGSIDVSGTADLATQYNITTRTLTNLTVNYTGTTQTIAAGTYPLLTISGGGTKTLGGAVISTGTVTINSGNTLDVSTSNFTLNVGGDWTNNGTFVQRSGTVNFDGINAQSIGGTTATTFNNLTISNTAAAVSVTNNINVQGTLNVNGTNAQLSPSATSVINSGGAGTSILTGTGIVYVSRVAVTADFKNQYVFNTYTLGTLTVNYNGSGNQTVNFGGTPAVNYSNLIISGSGIKTMDAAITATNLTGNLTVNSGTFFTNNLNIGSPANRTITVATGAIFDAGTSVITYGATIRVLNLNGTFRTANTNGFSGGASTSIASTNTPTLVLNSASTVEYYGVGAQTITLSHNYGNLQINGVGTKTLAAAITTTNVTGDIIVSSGNLSNGGFAITGNNDNEINIGAGDSLSLTSTSSFPSGFGTFTIANTSTVLYSGANQNIASRSYGNLVASGTGTKVLLGNTTVNGNLTTSGTGFSASSFTLTVNGNWINNGTFTASTSTVILSGTSSQGISGSTSPTFNN